jgi:hypothetical protein
MSPDQPRHRGPSRAPSKGGSESVMVKRLPSAPCHWGCAPSRGGRLFLQSFDALSQIQKPPGLDCHDPCKHHLQHDQQDKQQADSGAAIRRAENPGCVWHIKRLARLFGDAWLRLLCFRHSAHVVPIEASIKSKTRITFALHHARIVAPACDTVATGPMQQGFLCRRILRGIRLP